MDSATAREQMLTSPLSAANTKHILHFRLTPMSCLLTLSSPAATVWEKDTTLAAPFQQLDKSNWMLHLIILAPNIFITAPNFGLIARRFGRFGIKFLCK